MQIREEMRDYTRSLMMEAHEKGTPVMRTLFYEFPEDTHAWEVHDEYMYGDKVLVAPILEAGAKERMVYLPGAGKRAKQKKNIRADSGSAYRLH